MTMSNGIYPYVSPSQPKVRIVEHTVEEYFDEDGKLSSRTTKTVTRYEEPAQTPYYVTNTPNITFDVVN